MCDDGAIVFGSIAHGAHAKYMRVPAHTLVPLPDSLSFEAGAAISCGTGTAYGALKRLGLEGDETLAVFGQGPVGLSATQLGVAMGARVIHRAHHAPRFTVIHTMWMHYRQHRCSVAYDGHVDRRDEMSRRLAELSCSCTQAWPVGWVFPTHTHTVGHCAVRAAGTWEHEG